MAEHTLEGGGLPMARLLKAQRTFRPDGVWCLCLIALLLVVAVPIHAQDEADSGAGPWVSSRLNPPEIASGEMTSLEILYGVFPEGELWVDRDSVPWYLRLEGSSLSSLYYHDEAGLRRRGALVRILFKVLAKETRVLDAIRLRIGDVELETPHMLLGIHQDGPSAPPTLSWLPGSIPLVEGEETFLLLLSDQILPEAVREAVSKGSLSFDALELPQDALFIRESVGTAETASPWAPLARYRLVPLKSGRFYLRSFSLELPSLGSVAVGALNLDVLPSVPKTRDPVISPGRFQEQEPLESDGPPTAASPDTAFETLPPFPGKPAVIPPLRARMDALYTRALHHHETGDIASCLVVLRRAERSSLLWRQARILRWQLERDVLIGPWTKEASAPVQPLLVVALCGFVVFVLSFVIARFRVTIRPGRLLLVGTLAILVMVSALLCLGLVHAGARGYLGSGQTALSKGLSLRALPDEALEAEGYVPAGQGLRVRASGAGWVFLDTGDRRAWAREDEIIRY